MAEATETNTTTLVIVGAGVAGLTLGTFLQRNGVACIVVEKHSRVYVEQRQRAGTLDSRGVRMFRAWGLEDAVTKDSASDIIGGIWIDEVMYPMGFDDDNNDDAVLLPQQVLVRNLTDVFLKAGGDLRYEAVDVSLDNIDSEHPSVRYRNTEGLTITLTSDYIAGCDGYHGISRATIPADTLTRYAQEYPYAWLTILAETTANPAGMAIHDRGLAGMIPRGENASRLYLQCPATDTTEQWPDERIWSELAARFGTDVPTGKIIDKRIVPLRCVVYSPMSHGRLYLLGDAAHIVSPMSAKGIHLALYDAEVLARAIIAKANDGDTSGLDDYSDTCLCHIWNYQAFAVWITELMHNAGDTTYEGAFRKEIARAELERQFSSEAASRLFSELSAGLL